MTDKTNTEVLEAPEPIDFEQLDLEKAFDDLVTGNEDESKDLDKLKLDLSEDESKEDEEKEESKSTDEDLTDDSTETEEAEETKETPESTDSTEETEDESELTDEITEDTTLVNEVATMLGMESDKEFEDSVDGLVGLAREAAGQLAEQQLNGLFEELPDVQQYMQFRLQGGSAEQFIETFYPTENYATLKIDEEDTSLQERLVRKSLVAMNQEDEDIAATIEEYKTSGILFTQSQRALKGLVKFQASEKKTLVEQQNNIAEQEQKDQEAYIAEVKKSIKGSSNFMGIVVSEKEKDGFTSYVSNPVQNGQSQFQLDMQEAPTEVMLAIAALMRKEFDFTSLVTRKANSLNASKLRDRLKSNQQKKLRSREEEKGHVDTANVEDLDLSL